MSRCKVGVLEFELVDGKPPATRTNPCEGCSGDVDIMLCFALGDCHPVEKEDPNNPRKIWIKANT